MKIFITGATGLIGRNLINKLIEQVEHVEISALTRDICKAQQLIKQPVHWVGYITQDIIDTSDVVINLAGEPIADKRWTAAQKLKICKSRWDITEALAKGIKSSDTPPHTFISGSAVGIYGRQKNTVINEAYSEYYPEFSNKVCQKWESLALSANQENENKTRVAILRTGIVLDKNAGALAKMLLPFKYGLGGKIATGEQYMSWIHIKDMVAAILYIINTESLSGAINITAPGAVSNQVFSSTLSKELVKPCFLTTPVFALRCLFGEMADLLIYGQNVYPKKLINEGYVFNYPKLTEALSDLLKAR